MAPFQEEQTPISNVMEGTSTPCGDAVQMDSRHKGWFFILRGWLSGLLSKIKMLCLIIVRGRVLLIQGLVHIMVEGPNYVSGLADQSHDIVHASKQPL